MDVKIIEKVENKLLKRVEVKFSINHKTGATPSRLDVRNTLAAKLSKDTKLVVIPKIESRYGFGESKGIAHVYKSEKDLLAIEPKYVLKRFEEKKVEVKPAEETPKVEETPKEEEKVEDGKEEKGKSEGEEGAQAK